MNDKPDIRPFLPLWLVSRRHDAAPVALVAAACPATARAVAPALASSTNATPLAVLKIGTSALKFPALVTAFPAGRPPRRPPRPTQPTRDALVARLGEHAVGVADRVIEAVVAAAADDGVPRLSIRSLRYSRTAPAVLMRRSIWAVLVHVAGWTGADVGRLTGHHESAVRHGARLVDLDAPLCRVGVAAFHAHACTATRTHDVPTPPPSEVRPGPALGAGLQ